MRRDNNTQLNTDNRGMTLIEVVVSLLILMIIVVPMLSSFITATKSNKRSKDVIYAHTAGENVMEAVKVLGVEETAREFSDCGLKDFSIVPKDSADNYYETAVAGGNLSIASEANGKKSYVPLSGNGTYEYRIEGVQEGTDKYDLDITISAVDTYSGVDGPNSYQYADLTAFSSDAVAVINPVIQGSTYDNKALSYFSNMNKRIMNDRYTEARKRIDDYNRALWEAYNREVEAGNSPSSPVTATYPPASDYKILSPDQVSECISKKVVVKINELTDADGNKQYVLNSELIYSCRNIGDASGNPLFSTETDKYPVNDDAHPIVREPYNGYCRDQRYASLDTVMLIYRPFNDINNLHKETIEVIKDSNNSMDLFIALQGSADADYGHVTNKPNLIIDNQSGSELNLYSQADFNITGNIPPSQNIHKKLIADLPAGNKLYNISVKVYEYGSSFSKLVSQIDSTMLDD